MRFFFFLVLFVLFERSTAQGSCPSGQFFSATACANCAGTAPPVIICPTCNSALPAQCTSCSAGYYMTGGTPPNTCTACPAPCDGVGGTCTGATGTTCTGCQAGFFLDNTGASPTCTTCNVAKCATCTGTATTCLTCPAALPSLYASACYLTCTLADGVPNGFYADPTTKNCLPCDPSCATCTASGISGCSTCAAGGFLAGAAPNKCSPCDPSCYTCSGSAANQCTSCPSPGSTPWPLPGAATSFSCAKTCTTSATCATGQTCDTTQTAPVCVAVSGSPSLSAIGSPSLSASPSATPRATPSQSAIASPSVSPSASPVATPSPIPSPSPASPSPAGSVSPSPASGSPSPSPVSSSPKPSPSPVSPAPTVNSTDAPVYTAASLDELKSIIGNVGITFGAWSASSITAAKISNTVVVKFGSFSFVTFNSDSGPVGTVSTNQGKHNFKSWGNGCKKAAMSIAGPDDLKTATGLTVTFPSGLKAVTHMVIARFDANNILMTTLTSLIQVEVTVTSITITYAYRTPENTQQGASVTTTGGSLGACSTPVSTCRSIASATSTVSAVSGTSTSGAMHVSAPAGLFVGLLAALYVMMA